jgi:hypothetical protein
MPSKIKSFRDLDVWRLGKEIVLEVYQASKTFPKEEQYGLVNQMRRAALGSCAELETQLELSWDLGFLDSDKKCQLLEKLNHESRMLQNLIKKLDVDQKT